ncbi:hypothetical protein BEH94_10565 [Candidatus Altiarchaeales archaeon WOR_SM1_SCG]|nr:hypothetical protein BEH94_10565 [Candidatus Altiarchaeales archaeon WOR_SM1_SCG]
MKITQNPVGYLDAWDDKEEYLYENFVRTIEYGKINGPNIKYISGRKGDGKTAIALMLQDEEKSEGELLYEYNMLLMDPDFYRSMVIDWREHILSRVNAYASSMSERIDLEGYFQKMWKYMIYISAMKAITIKNPDETLKPIWDFLKEISFPDEREEFMNWPSQIVNEDLTKVLLEDDDSGLSKPLSTALDNRMNERTNNPVFINALETLRRHLNKDNRVLIVIDTLEKYYVTKKEDYFNKAVQGMMRGVYDVKALKDEDLFSWGLDYKKHVKQGGVNDTLKKAFDANNHPLLSKKPRIIKEKDKCWRLEDGDKTYNIKHIGARIKISRDKNRWIDIKCFVPDELYEDLAAWNLHKVRDSTVFLEWKYKELLRFICKRYMSYLKKNYRHHQEIKEYETKWNNLDKNSKGGLKSFWNEFFPETIKSRFGANEDCFNYILRHTQNKPRQVIHLVNNIINCAEANGRAPNHIDSEDVRTGVHRDMAELIGGAFMPFSENYTELTACIRKMFQGQENILEWEVVRHCINGKYEAYDKMGLDAEEVERILLRSGLVGLVSGDPKDVWIPDENKYIKLYETWFEYLVREHLENRMTDESLCGIHSILADYYGKGMKPKKNSHVVPYAGGLEYDGEEDDLHTPKE